MDFSYEKLLIAYKKTKKKVWSSDYEQRKENETQNLQQLYYELCSDSYSVGIPNRFIITDPKLREIIAIPFRDRIVQHLIHDALYPLVESQSFYDIYSNRIWKWTLFWVKRVSHFLKSASENCTRDCRILKLDIQNFFLSIDKNILYEKIVQLIIKKWRTSNRYDWQWIVNVIQHCIFKDYRIFHDHSIPALISRYPFYKSMLSTDWYHGLPLWNLTSQLFANIYMYCFDHRVKHCLKIKRYGRYVDDFILIHRDKEYLKSCLPKIIHFLKSTLQLTLHPNKIYFQHYSKGVKFLWVMIYPYYRILSKKTIGRWLYKLSKKNIPEKSIQVLASYDGFALHHNCFHVREMWRNMFLRNLSFN